MVARSYTLTCRQLVAVKECLVPASPTIAQTKTRDRGHEVELGGCASRTRIRPEDHPVRADVDVVLVEDLRDRVLAAHVAYDLVDADDHWVSARTARAMVSRAAQRSDMVSR